MDVLGDLRRRAEHLVGKDRELVTSLAAKLEGVGFTSARLLEVQVREGPRPLLSSAFPNLGEPSEKVLKVLDEFFDYVQGRAKWEAKLRDSCGTPRLSDMVELVTRDAKKRRQNEEVVAGASPGDASVNCITRDALKARCTWSRTAVGTDLKALDEKEMARWSGRAVSLLEACEAPSWLMACQAVNPAAAFRGLLGSARPATIRLRVRAWEAFVRWLRWRKNACWPKAPLDIIDYIAERMDDCPVASFPRAFGAALVWFEARAGWPAKDRLGGNEQVRRYLEKAGAEVGEGLGTVKRAPRFPLAVVASLELAVLAEDRLPEGLRVLAWMRLVKVYGVLRADDIQRLCWIISC